MTVSDTDPIVEDVVIDRTLAQRRRQTLREVGIQAFGIGVFYVIVFIFFAIEAEHFYPSPSPLNCPGCPYRKPCRAWRG